MEKKKRRQKKNGYENATSKILLITALIELLTSIADTIQRIADKEKFLREPRKLSGKQIRKADYFRLIE